LASHYHPFMPARRTHMAECHPEQRHAPRTRTAALEAGLSAATIPRRACSMPTTGIRLPASMLPSPLTVVFVEPHVTFRRLSKVITSPHEPATPPRQRRRR
jgi:hypothetical protein